MQHDSREKGFGLLGVLVVVIALAVVVGAGTYVYHAERKAKTTSDTSASSKQTSSGANTKNTTSSITSSELVSVAKQVYFTYGSNPQVVGTCGTQSAQACPFTTDLITKIDSAKIGSSSGANQLPGILIAGIQNGPFGTLSYDATPGDQGGTVSVQLTPDASLGGAAITWKLTMVQSAGKLQVSDILYSQTASGARAACDSVEIYDYLSCFQ